MPQWIHGRAEHILARNPSMPKSEAFAIATQQGHATGHTPKGYGTSSGKHTAKAKYDTPKNDEQVANPGKLTSKKMEKKGSSHAGTELAGLGVLAVPSLDYLQAAGRSRIAGDKSQQGLEKRRLMGEGLSHAAEVAGLGTLAVPELKNLMKKAYVEMMNPTRLELEELREKTASVISSPNGLLKESGLLEILRELAVTKQG